MALIVDQFGKPIESPSRRRDRRSRALQASYDAAQTTDDNIRHWAAADGLSADAANNVGIRETLRRRARYEVANNSYLRGIVRTLASETIGRGPRLQLSAAETADSPRATAAVRFVETEFAKWAKAIKLPQKLRTMRKAMAQDGEAFAILTVNEALPTAVKLDLKLIEADQCTTPDLDPTDENAVDGLRFDDYGNPIEYHFLKHHPGDDRGLAGGYLEYDRVPAEFVIHLFAADRPGQHRGIPEIMAALPLGSQLRRFVLATIAAAELCADHAGVLHTTSSALSDDEIADLEPLDPIDIEKRSLMTLPKGWTMSQLRSEHPATTFGMFKKEIISEMGCGVDMPRNIVACDSSDYNYASGRLDHQKWHKSLDVTQSELESDCLDPVYTAWLDEASLIEGYLPPSEQLGGLYGTTATWMWPGREHVDPTKEATAQQTRLLSMTTTLADECAREGKDWEQTLQQRARELKLMRKLGLAPLQDPSQPNRDSDDEEEEDDDVEAFGGIFANCGTGAGGFKAGNSCGGGRGGRGGGRGQKVLRVTGQVARGAFNAFFAAPNATFRVLREAGISKQAAVAGWVVASLGDTAIPMVPAGSALVISVASIRNREVGRAGIKLAREELGKAKDFLARMRGQKPASPSQSTPKKTSTLSPGRGRTRTTRTPGRRQTTRRRTTPS